MIVNPNETARLLLLAKVVGGGGGDITTEALNVDANGTYTAPQGKAYTPVRVSVPNTYTAGDEGKVVSSGALVSQTSRTVTENGTIDTTLNDSVTVNVPSSGGQDCWWQVQYFNNDEILLHTEFVQNGQNADWGSIADWAVTPNGEPVADILDNITRNLALYGYVGLAVKIWTKSTGGGDAAVYAQTGLVSGDEFIWYGEIESVIYISVSVNAKNFGVATLKYSNMWNVTAAKQAKRLGYDTIYSAGDVVASWNYSTKVPEENAVVVYEIIQ